MTISEGQIGSLKQLKESLYKSGITRFNSVGEINSFLKNYESEKKQLPSKVESQIEAEIQDMQSTLLSLQNNFDNLKTNIRDEITERIQQIEVETKQKIEKSSRNTFYKVFYFLKIKYLTLRKSNLENNLESIIKKKTRNAEEKVTKLRNDTKDYLENKNSIFSERHKKSLEDLTYTKNVVDGLYTLIAGAIGENFVVKELQKLSDDFYLINDFSKRFNPPIYNKKDNDRICSIQIDHLLICKSGIFLLETKNWSKSSLENLSLRSPVKQILRTSFALFTLLNSDSKQNDINLLHHHWGAKKIPIRNIIVLINKKPKEEFKHVKVLTLNELIGYIKYFDQTFNGDEIKGIFEYLKNTQD